MIQPDFNAFCKLARQGNLVPVYDTFTADTLTPVSAYVRLAHDARYACLLESVEGGERLGRYSFIGFGDAMQVRLDHESWLIGDEVRAVPRTRDELLNEVWGYENYPATRTVDNFILRLRKKLEKDPANPVHFRTVHGVGYRFSAASVRA